MKPSIGRIVHVMGTSGWPVPAIIVSVSPDKSRIDVAVFEPTNQSVQYRSMLHHADAVTNLGQYKWPPKES